jgi:hypothetical protein
MRPGKALERRRCRTQAPPHNDASDAGSMRPGKALERRRCRTQAPPHNDASDAGSMRPGKALERLGRLAPSCLRHSLR